MKHSVCITRQILLVKPEKEEASENKPCVIFICRDDKIADAVEKTLQNHLVAWLIANGYE